MILAFDIETVPDFELGRKIYKLEGIDDLEVSKAMMASRRTKVPDSDFLPLHQHKIIAISVVARWDNDSFTIQSLGKAGGDEKSLVQKFFRAIDKVPTLVTWNGSGFDLPVLNYRALRFGIQNRVYWDTGDFNKNFRWNNYQSRYHKRHVDVMEVLARYNNRAFGSLDEVSQLIGLPGKIGIGGDKVLDAYLNGQIEEIQAYCDIDVLNTYLVFQRFRYIEGSLKKDQYLHELELTKNWLNRSRVPQFQEFLSLWSGAANLETD